MSQCQRHPATAAAAPCAQCAAPLCEDCRVTAQGRSWCRACLTATVALLPPPTAGTIRCREADQAFRLALIGIFVLGPVLEPIALVRASQARRLIAADTRLAGDAKVAIATAIAVAALAIWGIVLGSKLLVALGAL